MLGPLVTVRCPDCRGLLSAHAPALPYPSWVSCPHCGRPVPVVPPQDPPPLFSWEAYPQLYASPDRGRRLGPAIRRAGTVMLVAITLFLAAGATTLLAQGALATSDHPYDVGGVVEGNSTRGAPAPLSRAWVNVTGENGFEAETISGAGGGFRVDGVPAGGISVSVAASGYAPVTLELFADPVFSSPAGNLTGLAVDLEPGGPSSATTFVETPYPSLE
ncbi:MAG: carboxypeptidase-like regulatory domain-containing protein, partial [Thermoplasmata archaeon]